MNCPVCYTTISTQRKKQIKHLYTHSVADLALTVLHLDRQIAIYRSADTFRQEQPATQALDDPAALFSLIAPAPAASEENSEEDADFDPGAAGMQQCAHCGLWVWPGDMPYHLDVACPELWRGDPVEQPAASDLYNHMHNLYPSVDPVAAPVGQAAPVEEHIKCGYCGMQVSPENYDKHGYNCPLAPGDNTAPVEERGDYAAVEYIRIPVDGAEYMLLNALALYIHRTKGNA